VRLSLASFLQPSLIFVHKARAYPSESLAPGKLFQPGLIFVDKARAYPSESPVPGKLFQPSLIFAGKTRSLPKRGAPEFYIVRADLSKGPAIFLMT
jgi:hypothetical protein